MPANLEKQLFSSELQRDLTNNLNNEFLSQSILLSTGDEKQVNIPIATSVGSASVNPSYPLTPSEVTDTAEFFENANHSTPLIAIPDDVEAVLAYDKEGETRRQFTNILMTSIADYAAHEFAVVGGGGSTTNQTVIETTGTGRAADYTGMTGTRKALTLEDIANARKVLDQQNLPNTGATRVAVITPEMHADLMKISEVMNRNYNMQQGLLNNGSVMEIYGFQFYVRSRVNLYDDSNVLQAVGSAVGATDEAGAIFYQSDMVYRSQGSVSTYVEESSAYQGYTMSSRVRAGFCAPRNVGVVNVIAAA